MNDTASSSARNPTLLEALGCLLYALGLPTLVIAAQRFTARFGAAIFAVASTVILASVAWAFVFIVARRMGTRGRIAAVITGFCALIVSYAFIYTALYQRDHTSFVLNTSRGDARQLEAFDESYRHLREANYRLFLLAKLEAHPEAGAQAVAQRSQPIALDPVTAIKYNIVSTPTGPSFVLFEIFDHGREVEFSSTNPINPVLPLAGRLSAAKTPSDFRALLLPFIDYWKDEQSSALERLRLAAAGAYPADFLDFVYFSCVTMTTLGFGDITPNSTAARLTVVSQALLGVCYIAFSLGLLWPR